MNLDLIDEWRLFVSPVVSGGGTPYFPPSEKKLDLELIEHARLALASSTFATGACQTGHLLCLRRDQDLRWCCPRGICCGASPADEALLDNPAYGSLCGPHARFAEGRGHVRRYPIDVAPFLGLPAPPSAQDWRDAASLVQPGTYVVIRLRGAEMPNAWQAVQAFDLVQMIGERVNGVDCADAIPLGAADVPEMLELVTQTEPGPFLSRTIELGQYLGIRRKGALVAMAGERFHLEGWREDQRRVHQARPSWPGAGLTAYGSVDRGDPTAIGESIPARPYH